MSFLLDKEYQIGLLSLLITSVNFTRYIGDMYPRWANYMLVILYDSLEAPTVNKNDWI